MECCNKTFSTSQVFQMHKQAKHVGLLSEMEKSNLTKMPKEQNTKQIPCEACNEEFPSKLKLKKHLALVHEIVAENKCSQCSFTAQKEVTLSRHIVENHNNEKFICSFCGSELGSKPALYSHVLHVHTGTKKPCPKCSFSTRNAGTLRKHFVLRHTDSGETCNFCGNVYKNIKYHHKVSMCGRDVDDREKFPCPHCGKVMVGMQRVRKHVEQVHEQRKNKKCDQCPYATYSGFNLRLHVTKVHERSELKYEMCKHCDKTSSNMKLHMSTYHGLLL